MSGIQTPVARMSPYPVGFRFHPTDEELVSHYLKLKNSGQGALVSNIPEVDVCKFEPWDIPKLWTTETDDEERYFFGRRDVKYGRKSQRANRATTAGFWKPTGNDRKIKSKRSRNVIGMKKTLVFYRGRSQNPTRTNWVMHEYRADPDNSQVFVLYLLRKNPEENPDISTPEGVEYSGHAASPITSNSNNSPRNQGTPLFNMESGSPSTVNQTQLDGNAFASNGQIENTFGINIAAEDAFGINGAGESFPEEEDYELQAYLNTLNFDPATGGLETIFPAAPQSVLHPNHGPSYQGIRFFNAFTRNTGEIRYQNAATAQDGDLLNQDISDESICLSPADRPGSSDTDNEILEFTLFDTHSRSLSKPAAQETVRFETKSSVMESERGMVPREAGKKRSLRPRRQRSTGSHNKDSSFSIVEKPDTRSGPNPPAVYVRNIFLGIILMVVLIGEVWFVLKHKISALIG